MFLAANIIASRYKTRGAALNTYLLILYKSSIIFKILFIQITTAMKKFIHLLAFSCCLLAIMSFMPVHRNVIGIYTVPATDPSKIELKLNGDHTFMYQDLSNAEKPIAISGRWYQQGEYVLLKDYVCTYKLHYKWRITADGQYAKAKMGATFYSLKKQAGC